MDLMDLTARIAQLSTISVGLQPHVRLADVLALVALDAEGGLVFVGNGSPELFVGDAGELLAPINLEAADEQPDVERPGGDGAHPAAARATL